MFTLLYGSSSAAKEFAEVLRGNEKDFVVYVEEGNFFLDKGLEDKVIQSLSEVIEMATDLVLVDFSITRSDSQLPSEIGKLIQSQRCLYIAALSVVTATALSQKYGSPHIAITSGIPGFTKNKSIECAVSLVADNVFCEKIKQYWNSLSFEVQYLEDRVGLVAPRILATLINEAAFAVQESVASIEDIDNAMKLGVNYPKGLLAWGDEIGLDYIVALLDGLYEEYHQERYRAAVILRQYVRAGRIGVKSGQGFYTY